MDAFQEGQQYALSTEGETSKSLYFVKLTDSALQSIEIYLKSKGESSLKPTINFQDNSGTISFPLNGRKQNYGFTLSNTDTDGLQSSFQCLQHMHNKSFKSLGILLKRMNILAKEDSYEKTKFKMAAAEKEQKSFCTKEIKSSGAVLGRKLKVKRPGLVLPSENFHPAFKKPDPLKFNQKNKSAWSSTILKPSIRKRIIHILATKPYKKPELLLKLKKEGITDNDRKKFDAVLTSVGTLKGDVYNLASHLWDEVQENWKFCSKEDLQLIQRRKQQSLKLSNENGVSGSKTQDNCCDIQENITSEPFVSAKEPFIKKRRISLNSALATNHNEKDNSFRTNSSNKIKIPSVDNSQELPEPHPQLNGNTSQEKKTNSLITHGNNAFLSSHKLKKNSDEQANNHSLISGLSNGISSKKLSVTNNNAKMNFVKFVKSKNIQEGTINNSTSDTSQKRTFNLPLTDSGSQSNVQTKNNSQYEGKESKRYECSNANAYVNKTSQAYSMCVIDKSKIISPVSCSSSSETSLCNKDNKECYGCDKENPPSIDSTLKLEYSDCIQKYTAIASKEQRSQYAKEFNTQYEEYLKLHARMKDTSLKFMMLEDSLNACEEGSSEFKKIRAKIQKENKNTLQSSDYICAWKKFNFLQSKLSHIKKLIKEYDSCQDP